MGKAPPLDMPSDFTPWDGQSDLPPVVDGFRLVDVWFRMGRKSVRPLPAHKWHWKHVAAWPGSTGDIIGWRFPPFTEAPPIVAEGTEDARIAQDEELNQPGTGEDCSGEG